MLGSSTTSDLGDRELRSGENPSSGDSGCDCCCAASLLVVSSTRKDDIRNEVSGIFGMSMAELSFFRRRCVPVLLL